LNTHNPYTPPTTQVADAEPPRPVVRKPISVFLLQLVCALLTLLLLSGIPTVFKVWRFADGMARVASLISLLLQLLFVSLFVWTIIATQRRSQFGRWLGVFLMGSAVALLVLAAFQMRYRGEELPMATTLGFYIGFALSILVPLSLVYFPAFSRRARAWYARS
jgi:hypothetical protein